MTWTKLGDEFGDECWEIEDDGAWRLHTEGLIWSNKKHTDGRLLKSEMGRWAKRPEKASLLVDIGWWEDRGDHYQIIRHQGWQRSASEWFHQSAVNAQNRRKGKARPVRAKDKPSNDSSNDSSDERVWSGLDRTGLDNRGTSLSAEAEKKGGDTNGQVCADCRERPAAGLGWDPTLCRRCLDDRVGDYATEDAP